VTRDNVPVMYDVIIIGGSYAGLAAALQLGRARRQVLVLDAGQRRNRSVSHSHGFLSNDGVPPGQIAAKGKAEVLAYPTVKWRDESVLELRATANGFAAKTASGEHLARRLILATGVVDDIPAIAGIAERWGQSVFHCPYCDGYERNRGPLGVLATAPLAIHYAQLVAEWSTPGGTTVFLDESFEPSAEELASLAARGIVVERSKVVAAEGPGGGIVLRLQDGRSKNLAALFVMPHTHLPGAFAEQLGCAIEEGPTGPFLKTDESKETSVAGVFACGDVALPKASVSFAVADGVRAGVAAHQSLVFRPDAS
jgi:thioredoxin reductase